MWSKSMFDFLCRCFFSLIANLISSVHQGINLLDLFQNILGILISQLVKIINIIVVINKTKFTICGKCHLI